MVLSKNSLRLVFCFFLFTNSWGWAQKNDIEVSHEQSDSTVVFIAKNNTEVRHEITLNLTVQNLKGYSGPITQLISSGESIPMITLGIVPNEPWSYSTSYSYNAKPTEEESKVQQQQLKLELLESLDTKNNTIIVFYGEGCARSEYARNFLEKKQIPFKYVETRNNEHYNKIMFHLIKLQDPDTQRIEYPVFLMNDTLEYDIKNLKWYLKELTANYK